MDKDKYLNLCEQMGEDPDPKRCPPDFEDFPLILQQSIELFNRLGDRVYPDIGYMGKDYSAVDLQMEAIGITDHKDIVAEALVRLDAHMIKRSAEQLKQARKAAEKKSSPHGRK